MSPGLVPRLPWVLASSPGYHGSWPRPQATMGPGLVPGLPWVLASSPGYHGSWPCPQAIRTKGSGPLQFNDVVDIAISIGCMLWIMGILVSKF